jgi:hypothetical protein
MSALSIQPTYPIFTDIDGQPLEDGYVWIGVANLAPIVNPITVYWDAALTIPAAQPIRTRGGYPMNSGTPARLYVNSDYSIQVQNKNGSVVYSAPTATERYNEIVISGMNAEDVVYDPPFTGATSTNVEAKLSEQVSIKDFGAIGNGVTNCSTAILNALQSGAEFVYVPPGTYAMSNNISPVISRDVTFYGHGTIIYTGATNNTNPLIAIETGNNTLTIDGLSFDGADKIAMGVRVFNTAAPSSNTLPNCTISNNLFIRFRMNVTGIWNAGAYVSGSFQLVTIAKNRIRLITRAAGTGTPGSSGTAGIEVTQYSNTQYIRECLHYGNQYAAILGGDPVGSANNVDYDGFKFFGPSPAADSGQYAQATLTSYGNVYRNCRGRALKIQSIGSVRDETVIRDDDYTNFGGSVEINFQYGVGMVSNCQFIYRPYNSGATSPIQTGLNLVSFYQGADYGEDTGGAIVNGIQVFNSIPGGVGNNIRYIVQAGVGSGVSAFMKPLVSVSNVSVNKNPINAIAQIGYEPTTYGTLRLDNITIPELVWSAVTTNGTDTNFDIVATNVFHRDGIATPANAKPFVATTLGAPVSYGGMILGALNQGFLATYVNSSSTNKGPLLAGAALSSPSGSAGGSASVQSISIADDGTYQFDARFYNNTRGLFAVSVNYDYTTQGLFATGSNQIHKIAVPVGELFEVSTTGTNPDVDNRFNMWYTGGKLNVKNRLGDSYVVTVTFMG